MVERFETASRHLRAATWLRWLIAVLAVSPQPWHQLRARFDPMIDMHVYRDAGVSLLHHQALYSHYTLTRVSVLPFTYPPLAAVLAAPLALASFPVASAIWDLGVYATLYAVLRAVLPAALRSTKLQVPPRWQPWLLPASFAAASWLLPIREQVHYGQVDLFLMGLVVLDLLSPRSGRWQGSLTGLAAAIKLTPALFIVGLWCAGRRRAAVVAACTAAFVTGVTAVALPGYSSDYWFGAAFDSNRLGDNSSSANQAVRGILLRTPLSHLNADLALIALATGLVALGLTIASRAWRTRDDLLAVSMIGVLAALISPVGWEHHFVYVLPLTFWLLTRPHLGRRVVGCLLVAAWWPSWSGVGESVAQAGGRGDLVAGRLVESLAGVTTFAIFVGLTASTLLATQRRHAAPSRTRTSLEQQARYAFIPRTTTHP